MEIVVGTYEQIVLGWKFLQHPDDPERYQFKSTFLDEGHTGCIKCLAVADDGFTLASGSSDERIKLMYLQDHVDMGALLHQEGTINCLAFSQNTHLLSGSDDGSLCIWDCQNWECVKTLKGHRGPVYSLSVHPSGRLALTVSKDKTLRTWNLLTGRSAFVTNLKQVATHVLWSPSGDLYAVAMEKKVVIYKLATASLTYTMEFPKAVLAMCFMEPNILVVGGEFEGIHIYDVVKEKCLQVIKGYQNRVKGILVVPNPFNTEKESPLMVTITSDGNIRVWLFNPENYEEEGKCLGELKVPGLRRPTCLAIANKLKFSWQVTPQPQATGQTKGQKKEGKVERSHSQSETGDEPKKKRHRIRKKRGSKKSNPASTETDEQKNTSDHNEEEPASKEMDNDEQSMDTTEEQTVQGGL